MKSIFPKEIIEHTAEAHFARFNKKIKSIYLLVIILIVSILVTLPVVNVEITRQSRGAVRSLYENNTVVSSLYGQVTENRLFENKKVNIGDTLLVLDALKLDNELKTLSKNLVLNQKYQNDLSILLNHISGDLQTLLYKNELAEYEQKIIELNTEIQHKEKDYTINKELFKKEVIAQIDFEKIEYAFNQALQKKELYKKQSILKWQTRLKDLEYKSMDVESRIQKSEKEKQNYVIIAPVRGWITHFSGVQAGNFIAPGQSIAQISPASELIVECYVSPSDIGYIRNDMSVNFQFDAFNYNQWGLGKGKVVGISPDIFQVENSSFFKVRCSLDQKHLTLKNGYVGNLKKGMSLTARFQVTNRTLFQLLYDKVDDWLNPRLKG
ncbi:HlyD family secretion protein [Ancylomarina longa]|uniref:HlyD family efflux transporter periplasmic adaptor subunit n=1 Tax=Ancylomarina longa TaxID=2487017 RepID=A0A434AF11_9BACT|nr:HlyD family efflux transporter periplasmic adaptor subunit [Ancylomarina longa]RUT72928.1 HlyD family efflux transporter periplasmic adaptor subunit [Ancylomarina longa]